MACGATRAMRGDMAKPAPTKTKRLSPAEQARVEELFHRFLLAERRSAHRAQLRQPLHAGASPSRCRPRPPTSAVNKATAKLFAVADTPQEMLALGEEGLNPLHLLDRPLPHQGQERDRGRPRSSIEQHGGEVPLNREALQALPGVGRKTASVVLNELRIEPAIAVDTHVFRVAHRLKLSTGKTPDKVEADLMAIVPEPYLTRAHHWLILHGRYTCVARRPKCEECPVADLCPSRRSVPGRMNARGSRSMRCGCSRRRPGTGAS